MSSARSYPRSAIDVRASRRLFRYSLLLCTAVIAAPWFAGMPALSALLVDGVALVLSIGLFRWSRGEVRKIVWQSDGRWLLTDAAHGIHEDVHLLPGIWIGASFLSLRWRCDACGRTFRATLLEDNCDDDAFRRLTVRLRFAPDDELFAAQSGQRMGDRLLAKFAGTSTVSRGGCRSSRSG